jgi:hypothetical protein
VALVVATLARDRPIGSAGLLLIPAIPAVIGGQAWAIAVQSARGLAGGRRRWRLFGPRRARGASEEERRSGLFGDLPTSQATALKFAFVCLWLTGAITFLSLTSGGPASASSDCPYRLNSHGSYKCVSRMTYVHVGAAEQRFAAAVIGGFFAMQLGASAAELVRRRGASKT